MKLGWRDAIMNKSQILLWDEEGVPGEMVRARVHRHDLTVDIRVSRDHWGLVQHGLTTLDEVKAYVETVCRLEAA